MLDGNINLQGGKNILIKRVNNLVNFKRNYLEKYDTEYIIDI